jgi:prepilin-type N-terminal cleavage/methylation domain-containing protein
MSLKWRHLEGESGFTLVEALITLVISGLLASALVSMLVGQSRFYERTDDQIYAEQSLRAAFDLMSAELRLGSPSDLLAAESDSVALRFDVLRAVVCDSTGADEATMMAYDTVTNAGLTGGYFGTAYSGPYEEAFEYADSFIPTETGNGSGPRATCVANGASGTGPDGAYATFTGWSGQFTNGVPDRGSFVRFYGKLSYRFAPSTFFTSGTALWRGPQELVGPFNTGASFSYVMDDNSVQNSVSAGDFSDVRAIRVSATAIGDGANRFGVQRTLQFDVPFRN